MGLVGQLGKFPSAADELAHLIRKNLEFKLQVTSKKLGSNGYALSSGYSVADAYLFTILSWTNQIGLSLAPWPSLIEYFNRMSRRPATVRAIQQAQGQGVSLEMQQGQNRISWDPEEVVFDLHYYTEGGVKPVAAEPETKADKKNAKNKKSAVTPVATETPRVSQPAAPKSVRDRLKELDQLKKDELITDKDYEEKKKELLKSL